MSFLGQTALVPGGLWALASLGGGGLAQRQHPGAAREGGPGLEKDGRAKGAEGSLPSYGTAFISGGGGVRVDGPDFSFLPFSLKTFHSFPA